MMNELAASARAGDPSNPLPAPGAPLGYRIKVAKATITSACTVGPVDGALTAQGLRLRVNRMGDPSQLPVVSPALYVTLVAVGTVVFCGIPLLRHFLRRPGWVKADPEPGKAVSKAKRPSSQPTRSRT